MSVDESIAQLREHWLKRANTCCLTGEERNKACADFLAGALAMCIHDTPLSQAVGIKLFLTSVRGASMFEKEPQA
jgi:hypothetical protein